MLIPILQNFSLVNCDKYHLINTSSSPLSSPVITTIQHDDGTYTTIVNNKVHKNSQRVYRLRPDANYTLRGSIIYEGDEPVYNTRTGYEYKKSYVKPTKSEPISYDILYVQNKKLVKIRNGQIFINGVLIKEDENLKKGTVHIYSKDGDLFVNDIKVMKKNPFQPQIIIPKGVELNLRGVKEFELKMRKNRVLWYKDAHTMKTFMNA